ncbi:EF-hand domain-containing protein [Thalassococcus sp. CAU 1522]|uniref:EF-hand domain-containing protein n=1 Tax=Thalassococcus arenae TaxID=2851652 RepID=A0ABS6NB69_9RHOB|nr:EF-hand domain-containing protein [Thalassococcus arenae]MBV2361274.1 EF-hand domain-containing protein [Thalassococcus arenae]
MKSTVIALVAALSVTGFAAHAEVADSNGDGVFSMEEMLVSYPDLTEETFAEIDADADGAINAEELAAAVSAGLIAG